jgi:hypothetical protein
VNALIVELVIQFLENVTAQWGGQELIVRINVKLGLLDRIAHSIVIARNKIH